MKRDILQGDVLERLREVPSNSVDCVMTSFPYWGLRDYGVEGQIGLEPTWKQHLRRLLPVGCELKRIIKPTGSIWINYGDTVVQNNTGARTADEKREGQPDNPRHMLAKSGNGPRKHKIGLHWRLRFLFNDRLGLISRSDVVWHKPNTMPLSMKDRLTPKYEMLFHFVKNPRYFFDLDAIRTPFADSTIQRINQATFHEQAGGPKDYAANGLGDQQSQRAVLERLAMRNFGHSAKVVQPGQRPHGRGRAEIQRALDSGEVRERERERVALPRSTSGSATLRRDEPP